MFSWGWTVNPHKRCFCSWWKVPKCKKTSLNSTSLFVREFTLEAKYMKGRFGKWNRLCLVHLFNCSSMQLSNQQITWQELSAFRHVDVVKTACWSSNSASEWRKKGHLSDFDWLLEPDGIDWVSQLVIYWDFPSQRVYRGWSKTRKISSEEHVDVRGRHQHTVHTDSLKSDIRKLENFAWSSTYQWFRLLLVL